jgi:hypothetical protein
MAGELAGAGAAAEAVARFQLQSLVAVLELSRAAVTPAKPPPSTITS